MHRISVNEYQAVNRIYNRVESIVGPYYGNKFESETKNFVSENRWIMFPVKGITTLREGTVYPLPNIFVSSFDDEIQDDGHGRVLGLIGITYHNVDAMRSLYTIIDPRRPSRHQPFLNILSQLGFLIEIQRKTKTDSPRSTPHYDTFRSVDSSTASVNQIMNAIGDSDNTLLKPGDIYPGSGNPILWSVTIFVTYKATTPSSFDRDIKRSFDAFQALLQLAQ
jgi:hypothetical protein